MKTLMWINIRNYIELEISIKLRERSAGKGNVWAKEALDAQRLRQSELETLIRESCDDAEDKR